MGKGPKLNVSIRVTDVPAIDLLTYMSTQGKLGGRACGLDEERVVRELGVELMLGDDRTMHCRIEQSLLDSLNARHRPPKLKCIILSYLGHPKANLSDATKHALLQFKDDQKNSEIVFEAGRLK